MATFTITFRIANERVGGRSYQERYEALEKAVLDHTALFWREPTSYIAFSCAVPIDTVAQSCRAAIAPSHDMFLLASDTNVSARICGKNDDPDIHKLMPHLVKV